MDEALKVAEWLKDIEDIRDVKACCVSLKGETFMGAQYVQQMIPPVGAKNPKPYDRHMFYLLGDLPKGYKRSSKECYQQTSDGPDWYIAGHYNGKPTKHQPFGRNFLLTEWDSGGKIDEYERRPYRRKGMTVTYF